MIPTRSLVVWYGWNATPSRGTPSGALVLLDIDPVRVVRTDMMQCNDVEENKRNKNQRQQDHVECEEAVQRDVRYRIVAP